MEIALVGDLDEEVAIDLVARTFGALPARETEFRDYAGNRARSFTQDRTPRVIRHEGDAGQALMRMIWPTRDGEDMVEAVKLELLERVVRLELLDSLREELGQTYSPGVGATQSRVWPDWGTFTISAGIATGDVDATREAMLDTIRKLRDAPVDDDTLLRARAPLAETYENLLKTNGGWMQLVDRAQTQPDRIARYEQSRQLIPTITAEDLQAMARRYLDPEQRLEIVVLPEGA